MAQLIDAMRFSDLVGAIYDCAIDPSGWPETLDLLIEELAFSNAMLSMTSLPSGQFLLNVSAGVTDEWIAVVPSYSSDIVDMWGGVANMWSFPLDRPSVLSRVNPSVLSSDNRYVRQWREPQGLIDSMVTILAHDSESIGNLAMGRHRDQGPIRDIDIDRASLFIPHLQRAAKISRIFDAQAVPEGCFEQVVERLATPVMLVGRNLEIQYANRAALDMVREASTMSDVNGRLFINAPAARKAIDDLIAGATDDETRLRGGAVGLPNLGDAIGMHSVHVLPLLRRAHWQNKGRDAAAALFFSSPRIAPVRLGEVMGSLFGFTGAETRAFEQLISGKSTKAAAAALGVAPSTVRTHLLRIFDKTGVHRQSDLLQLTAELAPPIGIGTAVEGHNRDGRS